MNASGTLKAQRKVVHTHPMTKVQLNFISISHPDEIKDPCTQRQIHQHVMKDIGLSRRKKRKRSGPDAEPRADAIHVSAQEDKDAPITGVTRAAPSAAVAQAPRYGVVLCSPTAMRAHSMEEFLFRRNSAFCMKVRELCFSLALFNDGAYYLALAEKALHRTKSADYSLPHQENAVSLRYYDQSVFHVNQHIQNVPVSQAISHEVLGVVLGLASYDLSVGNMQRWAIHMAALKFLINSRGGLHTYKSVFFRLSLLWTETTGSLVMDQKPHFVFPLDVMQPYHEPVVGPVLLRNLETLRSLDSQLADVATMVESLTGLTKSLALRESSDEDDYSIYCVTRARISYMLLHLPRADSHAVLDASAPTGTVLRETIRLAGLVLLLRLVGFVPGAAPGLDGFLEHHANRLGKLLECHDWRWTGLAELQLWVLTLAAVATGEASQRTLLAPRIAMLMEELNISWDGLVTVLHEVAWANGVFDGRLHDLEALDIIL